MSDRAIRDGLAQLLDVAVLPAAARPVTGGSINECFRYESERGPVFVKVAVKDLLPVFEAEAAGLNELRFATALRIPEVLGVGTTDDHALLALEWIDLHPPVKQSSSQLAEQLVSQHRMTQPMFGWQTNNFIGATPQKNEPSTDWVHFWRMHRLGSQLNLAAASGADAHFMERATLLSALMDGFFTSYVPEASLLHGDLWSGNVGVDESGAPVIFDPAVYYGDRECDLAMTRLFGGFDEDFYARYEDRWPLDEGASARIDLYNLYHILNHHNLFGGVYLARAASMVEKLLSDLGH